MTINDSDAASSTTMPGLLRRYVWNRSAFTAVILALPAIASASGSLVMAQWVDARVSTLARERDTLETTMTSLNRFKDRLEDFQLGRATTLMLLNAAKADADQKFMLDRLYRLNALDPMRQAAAVLYPEDWKARMKPYEDITAVGYSDPGKVADLQAIESAMIGDAAHTLVDLQGRLNEVARKLDDETATRTTVLSLGNSLMYVLTILFFFIRTAHGQKPTPGS